MHSRSESWSSWGYEWVSLGPETLPTFTTLSTLSINYFKMSPEPPNQSQLGLVTGLQTLPFSRKKAKSKDTMKKRDRKRGRASMCVCGGEGEREREVKTWWGVFHWSVALLCFVSDHMCLSVRMHDRHAHESCFTQHSALGWAARCHGTPFMNNRSWLPAEGSAEGEHLYGIKAAERVKAS